MLVLAWPGTGVILPNPRQDQELRVQEGSVLKSKSEEGGSLALVCLAVF